MLGAVTIKPIAGERYVLQYDGIPNTIAINYPNIFIPESNINMKLSIGDFDFPKKFLLAMG